MTIISSLLSPKECWLHKFIDHFGKDTLNQGNNNTKHWNSVKLLYMYLCQQSPLCRIFPILCWAQDMPLRPGSLTNSKYTWKQLFYIRIWEKQLVSMWREDNTFWLKCVTNYWIVISLTSGVPHQI